MARFGKSDKRTSFGKQSRAEKSFYDRKKKRPESGGSSDSFSERKFSKKSFSSGSTKESRPFSEKKFDRDQHSSSRFSRDTDRPFRRKRDEGSDERRFSERENKPRFSRSDSSEEKPFRKNYSQRNDDRYSNRENSKQQFGRGDSSGKRPFRKEYSRREEDRPLDKENAKPRFKRSDSSDEKPFHKKFSKQESRERFSNFKKFDRSEVKKVKPGIERSEKKAARPSAQERTEKNPDGLIRLNKFMANSGVGSRREADEFIKMGLVTVNGVTITEMGHKVKPTDDVRYEGRKLKAEQLVYILLNKPKGFITTTDDPEERKTVMELVASACNERIYPVGRLDRNTTGLLLLTNDGDLADKLTHPSYKAKKIYKVELNRPLTKDDFQKILDGVYFDEGRAQVDDLAIVGDDGKEVGIEIHIGWNRIVRRIFEALGYEVIKLDRVMYAGLDKKELARGQWRFLKPEEIVRLKHFQG